MVEILIIILRDKSEAGYGHLELTMSRVMCIFVYIPPYHKNQEDAFS